MDAVKRIAFVVNLAGLYAIPSDYCLENLNKSNCNVSPKQVFYYYKPGSRCEIGTWKGCPTLNKFDTEEECAHTCIYRDRNYPHIEEKLKANAICYKPINNKNCTGNYTVAFIYDKVLDKCLPINWGGCPHAGNVFQEKLDCLKICFGSNWNERIKEITKEQSDQVDTILDNFLNDSNTNVVSTSKNIIDVTLKGKLQTTLNDTMDNEEIETTTVASNDELETTVLADINEKEVGSTKEFHDTTTITPENVVESDTTSDLADNSASETVTDATESTITTLHTTPSTLTTTIPARTGTAKEVILPRDIEENNY